MSVKSTVLTPCSLEKALRAGCNLVSLLLSGLAYSSTLKMKATCSSETSDRLQNTQLWYPKDRTFY
jgi:hypothetical protein